MRYWIVERRIPEWGYGWARWHPVPVEEETGENRFPTRAAAEEAMEVWAETGEPGAEYRVVEVTDGGLGSLPSSVAAERFVRGEPGSGIVLFGVGFLRAGVILFPLLELSGIDPRRAARGALLASAGMTAYTLIAALAGSDARGSRPRFAGARSPGRRRASSRGSRRRG